MLREIMMDSSAHLVPTIAVPVVPIFTYYVSKIRVGLHVRDTNIKMQVAKNGAHTAATDSHMLSCTCALRRLFFSFSFFIFSHLSTSQCTGWLVL